MSRNAIRYYADLIVQYPHARFRRLPHLKSITDNVETTTPSGRFFFHMMASLAQMERELIAERSKTGLASAKAKGRIGGRKQKMTQSKIVSAKQLLASGDLPKDVAQNIGVSVPTLYRWIPASELDN